jgi:two-component system, cell cycle sensor histidine kinase and response regulator CckA
MFVQAQGFGQAFAAVILDLTVPGAMGGKETLARLLEIDPQVKAIVSSGYSDDPIMAEFAKYGFRGVIAKPYRISELSRVLNKVISKVI